MEPAQVEEPGGAAAVRHRAGCGITPVLDAIDDRRDQSVQSVRRRRSNFEANFDFILRRFVEGGPRRFSQKVDTSYGVATLDGRFNIAGRDWYWDINGVYGHNKAKQTMLGNINSDQLRIALGPLATCTATPGCVPFNIFGGAGSITPEMMDCVTFVQNDSSEQDLWDATANVSGSCSSCRAVRSASRSGVEYRELSGRFDPDPVVAAGFSSDIPALPTSGSYNVKEAYAELNAPIAQGRAVRSTCSS